MNKIRNILISVFVVIWLLVFNYESTRYFYLEPFFKRSLPKLKFLFPPAGWIMFFNVDDSFGHALVYGIKDGKPQTIDPHLILQTRAIGYDNIHRNALSSVLDMPRPFCAFLERKFPFFDSFMVTYVRYGDLSKEPLKQQQDLIYECR